MENMNWQDKYIDRLADDVNSIKGDIREIRSDLRGMEGRLMAHMDTRMAEDMREIRSGIAEDMREIRSGIAESNRHILSIMFAMALGIGAIVVAVWLK